MGSRHLACVLGEYQVCRRRGHSELRAELPGPQSGAFDEGGAAYPVGKQRQFSTFALQAA
jgi:hypothetical protein